LSKGLKEYVDRFNPDLIYCQIFSFSAISLVKQLKEYTNLPIVIHIMDDFPNIIIKKGIGFNYWKKKIDKQFKEIINKASICLSISEGMSEEYKIRYSRDFIPFRNPVDLTIWKAEINRDYKTEDKFVILYAGRLGQGIDVILEKVANSIEQLNQSSDIPVELFIQSNQSPKWIKKYKFVKHSSFIQYEKLPELFSSVNLLLLPYDFKGRGLIYIKYSMPTKLSEFMASGTPIVAIIPENTALYSYIKTHECAYIVNSDKVKIITDSIKLIIDNVDLRRNYALKSLEIVKTESEIFNVRQKFLEVLCSSIEIE
jgi:glycosyltransferase involved in cell wall biosynthesis